MLILSLLSAAMVPSAVCRAQEGTEKAEILMKEYRFEEALDALEKLLPEEGQEADSLFVARVEAAIDRAHNGLSMKKYCCSLSPRRRSRRRNSISIILSRTAPGFHPRVHSLRRVVSERSPGSRKVPHRHISQTGPGTGMPLPYSIAKVREKCGQLRH